MQDVEVSSFALPVLITGISQRREKINHAGFLTTYSPNHTALLVGGTWCFAKSGPWLCAIQFNLL